MKYQYIFQMKDSKNYYKNGEDKRLGCRNMPYTFKYEYKTDYMHGIGNNLQGLIHGLICHGSTGEHVKLYKNGTLIKEWIH